ncbi:MAG: PHP domain-containing protein [Candidatus Bathyarchaeia archaeon]
MADPLGASRMDLHIHTTFSDGKGSVGDVAGAARRRGLAIFAITDHYEESRASQQKKVSKAGLPEYLSAVEGAGALRGVEVEIYEDGSPSISSGTRAHMDLVIGGIHRLRGIIFWDDPTPVLDPGAFVESIRIVAIRAMESGLLDVLAHPTWLPEDLRPESKRLLTPDWARSLIRAASDNGVAMEASGVWRVPDEWFLRECIRQGVKISIGSDAHDPGSVGQTAYAVGLLRAVGAGPEDLFIPAHGGRDRP